MVFTFIDWYTSAGNFRLLPSNEQIKSDLVWAIQQEVIQSLLEDKNNFVISLKPYKVNYETVKREEQCQFLSSIIEVLQSGESPVKDINIVPMSLTYDLKFEELFDLNTSSSILGIVSKLTKLLPIFLFPGNVGCGKVRVDFDQPFSVLEFMKNAEKYNNNSLEYDVERYTENLHNHVVWNSYNLRRFSACDVYFFSKLNMSHLDFIPSFEKIVTDIKAKKRDVAFSGDSATAINYASKLIRQVQRERKLSSDIIQLYLGEMVMSSATCALLNTSAISCYKGTHAQIRVGSKQALIEEAKLLISLVAYEFPQVTPPCKDNIDEFVLENYDNFIGKRL